MQVIMNLFEYLLVFFLTEYDKRPSHFNGNKNLIYYFFIRNETTQQQKCLNDLSEIYDLLEKFSQCSFVNLFHCRLITIDMSEDRQVKT